MPVKYLKFRLLSGLLIKLRRKISDYCERL